MGCIKGHKLCLLAMLACGMLAACQSPRWQPQSVQVQQYVMQADSLGEDSLMLAWLAPYRDSLMFFTQEPIIVSEAQLSKGQPSSALGNILADLVLEAGRKEFGAAHLAMLNYGGIRAGLPADTIRRGHLMEMLPFANTLQLVVMSGELLQTFLDHWAAKGGTPMAGVRFQIVEGRASSVLIGGEPIDPSKMYEVVMPDYVANGGDGCGFLIAAQRQQPGATLLFDAVLNGFKSMHARGQHLKAMNDGRIYR